MQALKAWTFLWPVKKDSLSFGISFVIHLSLFFLFWQSMGQEKKREPLRLSSIRVQYVQAAQNSTNETLPTKIKELKVKTPSSENKKQKQKEIHSKRKEVLQKISKTLVKPAAIKAPLKPAMQGKKELGQKMIQEIKEKKAAPELKEELISSYEEDLLALFAQNLCLPRVGRVWLILYFDEKGSFIKMEEMDYENRDNLVYLQQILPRLCYPSNSTAKEQRYEICFDGSSMD